MHAHSQGTGKGTAVQTVYSFFFSFLIAVFVLINLIFVKKNYIKYNVLVSPFSLQTIRWQCYPMSCVTLTFHAKTLHCVLLTLTSILRLRKNFLTSWISYISVCTCSHSCWTGIIFFFSLWYLLFDLEVLLCDFSSWWSLAFSCAWMPSCMSSPCSPSGCSLPCFVSSPCHAVVSGRGLNTHSYKLTLKIHFYQVMDAKQSKM